MIKLSIVIALVLSFSGSAMAAGKTDIVRIDGTVFKGPDMRPASRVKDSHKTTKERRAKVRETGRDGRDSGRSGQSAARPPEDKTGCMIVTEIVELPDGRTVIRDSWRCERDIKAPKR